MNYNTIKFKFKPTWLEKEIAAAVAPPVPRLTPPAPVPRLTPPTPVPRPPVIWKEFWRLKSLAAEDDAEDEEEDEDDEDWPKPELFGPNPNAELLELDDELLAEEEDDELLPEELEEPANTALFGTWLREAVKDEKILIVNLSSMFNGTYVVI